MALGTEADTADIQDFADHVLRKESHRTSRFTSFTTEMKIARRFTASADDRCVRKAELDKLRELESDSLIRIWEPGAVYDALRRGPRRLVKLAADVRAAMRRNGEILIEEQIPAGILEPVNY